MDLKEKLRRRRKDNRLIVGSLAVLLILLTGLFYALQRGQGIDSALVRNKVLFFVLGYLDLVLILTIAFVLLRNLFKLLVERRSRILGSKLKTKLMVSFVGLSLIPVLFLFFIATELLERSVDRWLNVPQRQLLEQGRDVAQALREGVEQANLRKAQGVLSEVDRFDLADPQQRPALTRRLQELLVELGLDYLAVYEGTDFVQAVVNPQAGLADLPEPRASFLAEAAGEGEAVHSPLRGGDGLILAARARGEPPPDAADEPAATVVVAGTRLAQRTAEQIAQLVQGYQSFRQLEVQKEEIATSHFLFFLMMTLLILLASSWVGLYLARRITVPIQALAEGTRRIGRGELSHRVEVGADDELGVLVDSFNRMTVELERNKELLERSNRELSAINERLAEERALVAAVLANVAAGVISIDTSGRILTCNEAALTMLRQSEEEVLGRPVGEVWADPERARLAEIARRQTFARGSEELRLSLAGEWRTFEVKVTPMIDGSGQPIGRVLVLEDLTELIKAQQLAAWNEAARRIAHEIKNPLTPIRLSTERLLKKHREGDPTLGPAVEEAADLIVREVNAMQGMVDEFSRFARMPRPQPAEVDVERLVEETIHLYRDLKPGVEVRGRVAPEARTGWLDAEQVRRVLINLLDNALAATDAPGSVTVAAQRADGHLAIQVADTGRGIPRPVREKLFLPHFSTKGRGTGLGLSIVHRIVTDHQGSIRVEDNRPRGTVFTIELPLR